MPASTQPAQHLEEQVCSAGITFSPRKSHTHLPTLIFSQQSSGFRRNSQAIWFFVAFCPWSLLLQNTHQPCETNCAFHFPKSFTLPFQHGSNLEALGNCSLDTLLPTFHPAVTLHLLPLLVTQPGPVSKTQLGIKHQSSSAKGWPLPQAAHSLGSLAPTMVK